MITIDNNFKLVTKVQIKDKFSQAPAEVAQLFHSNSPHADTLRWAAWQAFPFQFCTTSLVPRESTNGENAACPFLSLSTKKFDTELSLLSISLK